MPKGRPRQEPKLVERGNQGWFVQFYDETAGATRRVGAGTRDRGQADRFFARWQAQNRALNPNEPACPRDPADISISQALSLYAEGHGAEVQSSDRIGFAIKRLVGWWKDRPVGAVLPVNCNKYRDARLTAGVSVGTARRELIVLRAAVRWCEQNGHLTKAPFVKVPPASPGKDRWLTRSEAARLLRAARNDPRSRLHLPLFIMIALRTGARSEAILSLKWFPQVDIDRGTIDFNEPGRARTKKQRPIIPIPRRLAWFLERARQRSTSPYVVNYHGEPIQRIKHSFASACARAGLDDVTPHTLRHTCGTWLAHAGVDLWQVAGWLGHSQERTTELYAHHSPTAQAAARRVLD